MRVALRSGRSMLERNIRELAIATRSGRMNRFGFNQAWQKASLEAENPAARSKKGRIVLPVLVRCAWPLQPRSTREFSAPAPDIRGVCTAGSFAAAHTTSCSSANWHISINIARYVHA